MQQAHIHDSTAQADVWLQAKEPRDQRGPGPKSTWLGKDFMLLTYTVVITPIKYSFTVHVPKWLFMSFQLKF